MTWVPAGGDVLMCGEWITVRKIQYFKDADAYVKPADTPSRQGRWYWQTPHRYGWVDTEQEAKAAVMLTLVKQKLRRIT